MSGYLHRIATSVLRPATGMHPSVGSLWTGSGKIEPPEFAVPLQQSPEPGTVPTAATNAGTLFPPTTIRDNATPSAEAHASRPTQTSATPMVDLTTAATRPSTVHPLVAQGHSDAVHPALFGDASPDTTQSGDLNRAAQPGPADHTITPLVEPSAQPSQLLRPLTTTAITHSMPVHQHETPGSTREPDEIQIHIGRIEVTATAPLPLARPATPPERRSIDLGEYLKRDRRQR